MANILHLSDTTLSGSPYRIAALHAKYSKKHESRHLVWHKVFAGRTFSTDMVAPEMSRDELMYWVHEWADILHFHNRWKRQELFKVIPYPKNKLGVIQIHSPREEEGHLEEIDSGLPLAIIAQYHVRQWKEHSFVVPNVVDINEQYHKPTWRPERAIPKIAYSPSMPSGIGWNRKSYPVVNPTLTKMNSLGLIDYCRITDMTHLECMISKQNADIGIDEVSTGSYHMSSLEFLSQGVCCIAGVDKHCAKVLMDLTGADHLPWFHATESNFKERLRQLIDSNEYSAIGYNGRKWMEKYWSPKVLLGHYDKMYQSL